MAVLCSTRPAGHLAKAANIVHADILADPDKALGDLPKATKIFLYCKSGRRADLAKSALEGVGYTSVVNLKGYDDVKHMDG